jgi:hypothetical protein
MNIQYQLYHDERITDSFIHSGCIIKKNGFIEMTIKKASDGILGGPF